MYYGSVYIGDLTGDVSAGLIRNDESFLTVDGETIGGCTDGYMNFNIWVAGTQGDSDSVSAKTTSTADLVCIAGSGANWYTDEDFDSVCWITCEYGYVSTHPVIHALWISWSRLTTIPYSVPRPPACARK